MFNLLKINFKITSNRYNYFCRLIEPRDIIVECGPQCGCGPNCENKISQKGLKYRLEVIYLFIQASTIIIVCI
jgi:hypothetical protein